MEEKSTTAMTQSKAIDWQIMAILKQGEKGPILFSFRRDHRMSISTFYKSPFKFSDSTTQTKNVLN